MLAPPGQTRAPRVSRAAHREPRQSSSSVIADTPGSAARAFSSVSPHGGRRFAERSRLARQSRTGLLDEVDGVPLALDRARLFLSGCRNSNLDDILTSALPAHPARALDHHIRRIAVFDIELVNLVEIQGSDFTGRVAKAFSVRAP